MDRGGHRDRRNEIRIGNLVCALGTSRRLKQIEKRHQRDTDNQPNCNIASKIIQVLTTFYSGFRCGHHSLTGLSIGAGQMIKGCLSAALSPKSSFELPINKLLDLKWGGSSLSSSVWRIGIIS